MKQVTDKAYEYLGDVSASKENIIAQHGRSPCTLRVKGVQEGLIFSSENIRHALIELRICCRLWRSGHSHTGAWQRPGPLHLQTTSLELVATKQ